MEQIQTKTQPQASLAAIVATVAEALGVSLDQGESSRYTPRPILATAVYDEDAATAATGTSYETRYRASRTGKLKCRRIGARRLYLGSDLLAWIGDEGGKRRA